MPPSVLRVKSSALGTTQVVAAVGELDVSSVSAVGGAVDRALAQRPETVVLDLSALSFCDSSGVRLTASSQRRADDQGARFVLVRPKGPARRVFEICDADDRLGSADPPGGLAPAS